MFSSLGWIFFLFVLFFCPLAQCSVIEFPYANFTFSKVPNPPDAINQYFSSQMYKKIVIAGVKVDPQTQYAYVSLPRWTDKDIPATLCRLVDRSTLNPIPWNQFSTPPLLDPWPSFQQNNISGNPATTIRSVLGFEIYNGKIYVLDQGRVENTLPPPNAIKLMIFDLQSGLVHMIHYFTQADPQTSFLNDIVLDVRDSQNIKAYITDSGIPINQSNTSFGGRLYTYANNQSHSVFYQQTFCQPDDSLYIHIDGIPVLQSSQMLTGSDGIAFDPINNILYFCPLTSHIIYSIPAEKLWNNASIQDVKVAYDRTYASDGLSMTSKSELILSSLEFSAVYIKTSQIWQNSSIYWPDTFSFDGKGNLLWTMNQLHNFLDQRITWPNITNFYVPLDSNPVYFIHSKNIGDNGYLFAKIPGKDTTQPNKLVQLKGDPLFFIIAAVIAGILCVGYIASLFLSQNKDHQDYQLVSDDDGGNLIH